MKLTLRQLLLLFTLLSALSIVGLSGYFFISNAQRLHTIQQSQQHLQLLKTIEKLLESLAEERGLHQAVSHPTLNPENTHYLTQAYRKATQTTDQLIQTLTQQLKLAPPSMESQWHIFLQRLKALPNLRATSNTSKTFDQYTHLINHGITLAQNMVFYLPTKQSLKQGTLFLQTLILREQAGRERGRVFKTLLNQHFTNEEYFAIAGHIQQQQLIMELFKLNADPTLLSWWYVKADESILRTIEKVRNILRQRFLNEQVLTAFLKKIGYNGFIHHFKNHLLHGDPRYYEKAQQDIKNALSLLDT